MQFVSCISSFMWEEWADYVRHSLPSSTMCHSAAEENIHLLYLFFSVK